MAAFPALIPASRRLTPGRHLHTALRSMGGYQTQVRHSNAVNGYRLSLTFDSLTNAQMISFRTHFISAAGLFKTFDLPAESWTGTTDPTLNGYSWRYVDRPQVQDVGCGRHNLSLELEMVPEAATVTV
jgi:hypothetical protein